MSLTLLPHGLFYPLPSLIYELSFQQQEIWLPASAIPLLNCSILAVSELLTHGPVENNILK